MPAACICPTASLAQGEMERAVEFLGHPYRLTRQVTHGKRLGSRLGFPTVNLRIPEGVIVPAFGVYATRVWVLPVWPDNHEPPGPQHLPGEGPYLAVTNVGVRPTVNPTLSGVTVEPWILDYQGDLYGERIPVSLLRFLRPEQQFPSVQELSQRIIKDIGTVRELSKTLPRAPES